MPFDGAIVLPRAPHADDAARLAAMRDLDHTDWLHYSFLYPRAARPGEAGSSIVFPTLRGFDGKPFGLGSSSRPVAGKVMVLVARGHTLLDDFSARGIFTKKPFYSARYPKNASLSSIPGFIVLHLDTAGRRPGAAFGRTQPGRRAGHGATLPRRQGLLALHHRPRRLPAPSGGTCGQDARRRRLRLRHRRQHHRRLLAGRGLSRSLRQLRASREPNDMLVQLVDAHGQPLDPAGTTMDAIVFDPPLDPVTDGGAGGLRFVTFPSATRELKVGFKLDDLQLEGPFPAGKFAYQFRHIWVGLWPGFGHGMKPIKAGEPVTLKLKEDFPEDGTLPPFVRICILHPGDELQTTAGGELKLKPNTATPQDGQAVHQDSELRLYTDQNAVTVFNTGADYFADLVKEAEDRPLEVLEGLYLTNWKSEPNVFLRGKMVAHGVERNDATTDEIEAAINALIATDSYVIAPLDPVEDPDPDEEPEEDPDEDPPTRHVLVTRTAEFASTQILPDAGGEDRGARRGARPSARSTAASSGRRTRRLGADRHERNGARPRVPALRQLEDLGGPRRGVEEHLPNSGRRSSRRVAGVPNGRSRPRHRRVRPAPRHAHSDNGLLTRFSTASA